VVAVVAVVSFSIIHITPGDPATFMLELDATEEDVERLRHQLGLDRPILVQFYLWLGRTLRGDLGESIFLNRTVVAAIAERLEPTLSLMVLAETVALVTAIPLGVLAAKYLNTWVDRTAMFIAILGLSLPSFWLALNLIELVGVKWLLLPVAGYVPLREGFVLHLKHMIMPAFSLGFIHAALITRMTRSSMLEVLQSDYIRTARAKGLSERVVLWRHALKNAALPTVTVIGLSVLALASGAVVIEVVFAIPGVGRLIVNAVLSRDYPLIQGILLMTATVYVMINLIVDILYAYLDPRIRY